MFNVSENKTPNFPFEYDHLQVYSGEDSPFDADDEEYHEEKDIYNYEVYRYY